ncbi:MAG: dihydroorotase [Simkaniaceae bacterium]|nr:dihydroorotase [Simkaniaceae bacterium]
MIEIRDVRTIDGRVVSRKVPSSEEQVINGEGLTLFPGLIDPHVHFRTPGSEHKENWETGARAAVYGGYTTVFDMPNTHPACVTEAILREKRELIDAQLQRVGIPLRYHLYFGADKGRFDEIVKVKDHVVGIKVFMGSSTGDLVIDDDASLHAVFAIAAAAGLIVSVHAEDEEMIRKRKESCFRPEFSAHSVIRSPEVARRATEKAIELAALYGTTLCIVHVSTKEETALIRQAKRAGLAVYAEATPHHLFLDEGAYETLGAKAQMNPPLRNREHGRALMEAIVEGTIDMIGTDHAPHTEEEKRQPYGSAPSGVPGIETALPLLLTAYHEGKLTLEKIVSLTRTNAEKIFHLPPDDDVVLCDLERRECVDEGALQTKCGWSPFAGRMLKGWPVMTIVRGKVYRVDRRQATL